MSATPPARDVALNALATSEAHGPTSGRTSALYALHPFWIVVAIFVWLAATAWIRPFMDPDEGRYAGVAYQMWRSGDWLVPRLDGLPFFHKPPLFYWIGAAAMALFGPSEWAGRLPSILGATLAAGSLFLFVRRWCDARLALWSAAILVTLPFFFGGAQFANLDMLVAGCIGATVLLAAHAALTREQSDARSDPATTWRWALAGAFVFAALGVLAKGLIGLVLPGAVFVLWCLATRRLRALRLFGWWPGWILFVLVAVPWMVLMQLRFPEFFDYFIVTQHFRRFAETGFNNAQPFWFYLPVIAALSLPWVVWLAVGPSGFRSAARQRPDAAWLMAIWFIVIVGFFSLPRSKLVGYVLPALPPLAFWIAHCALAGANRFAPKRKPLAWTSGIAAVLCVVAVIAVGRWQVPPGASLPLPAGQRIAEADQVLMLDRYDYEIPFYWRIGRPIPVSGDWNPVEIAREDNWRKELYDAGRFEPDAAARLLIPTEALAAHLCVPRVSWLVGPSNSVLAHPWLADPRFAIVTYNPRLALWRFGGSATADPQCLQTPNADSAEK